MRYPLVLVYESDGHLARMLRPEVEARKWFLREPRQAKSCLSLLGRAAPGVLVVRVGTDVTGALALVERAAWQCPEATTVVVSENGNSALNNSAWHLGAGLVLSPLQAREQMPAVVTKLMETAFAEHGEAKAKDGMARSES